MNRLAALFGAILAIGVSAGSAHAAPIIEIDGHHGPTVFQAGDTATYTFWVHNIGDQPTGSPATLTVDLPAGVTTRIGLPGAPMAIPPGTADGLGGDWDCPRRQVVGESSITCTFIKGTYEPPPEPLPIPAGGPLPSRLTVNVAIAPGTTGPLTAVATLNAGDQTVSVSESAPVGAPVTEFGIAGDSIAADAFDSASAPVRQAGAHPFRAVASFDLNLANRERRSLFGLSFEPRPIGTPRDIEVTLPRGFVGNPNAVAQCTPLELSRSNDIASDCPASSQIGVIEFSINSPQGGSFYSTKAAVYNMVPTKGALADFAFAIVGRPVRIRAYLDPRDNSVVTRVENINETYALYDQKVTLWGVPSDPAHDSDRFNFPAGRFGAASTVARRPFLTLPSECGVSDTTDVRAASWQNPTAWTPWLSSAPVQLSGCERLVFEPSITLRPDVTTPDSPTGLEVAIDLPQNDEPDGLGTPPLKDVRVVLPEGMSINPSSADGLVACADDQLRLGTDLGLRAGEPSCPEASKVGSVTALSPAIDGPVQGGVYVRSQSSDDPASGEMFRLALVLKDEERGLIVKLPGSVKANPTTGRLETVFEDNPQLPVSRISVRLKGGPRAPLATPATCGTKTSEASLSSWGGQEIALTDSFTIDCPGANNFAPGFDAGTETLVGGAFSPFFAEIDRPDRDQYLSGVSVDMPKGLIAKLKGVQLCPEALAAEGTPGVCPAASRIGTATVGAGAGNPFYLQGPVYLTDGYKGAPYGLSVQVRAKAGPFDLGLVKVAQAVHVDPDTAELSVVSDRLPQVVKGVPVRLRSVDVDIDRPGFTINPTSCSEKQIQATFTSVNGKVAKASKRFQAGDCRALAFTPKLAMRLTGKRQTKTGGHPKLKATLTQRPGQANVKSAKVTLPKSLALDANNSTDPKLLCDYDRALKADCSASSVIGKASAVTPVLDKRLAGNVHLVQGIAFGKKGNRIRTLPTLLVKLRGEVAIDLRAKTSVAKRSSRLETTFPAVPDAPVTKFTMTINGGPKGILTVTRTATRKLNLCTTKQTANVETDAQNGRRADFATRIKTPCAKQVKRKGKR